ncbi:hypothetical protein P3S68_020364 [Capsicum galapagoense]
MPEMEGNTGDGDLLLADYLNRDEENGYQVTPKGNTVLQSQLSMANQVLRSWTSCRDQ